MKKIAIIGGGVVGSTAAYLLSKEPDIQVTVFDEGIGSGTAASAGIISPWLSRRRNKKWYKMVKDGAAFYPKFLHEVTGGADIPKSVYNQVGTLLFKSKPEYLDEMLEIGLKRREDAPEIGELNILSPDEIKEKFPIYENNKSAVWASGGARVDGKELINLLLNKAKEQGAHFIGEKAQLKLSDNGQHLIESESFSDTFDGLVLSNAAWLGSFLQPHGYTVDIRPQKGQLAVLNLPGYQTGEWPVLMPEGEKDVIPFEDGSIIIGATHEDEKGFDLEIQPERLYTMIEEASNEFSKEIANAEIVNYKVGTRAYTSDFSPFFGKVPGLDNVVACSGLGSTGLTAGPLMGKILSQLILGQKTDLNPDDYPIDNYVKKV